MRKKLKIENKTNAKEMKKIFFRTTKPHTFNEPTPRKLIDLNVNNKLDVVRIHLTIVGVDGKCL